MDKNFATGWLHLCPLLLLDVAAPLAAGEQLSGMYASTPGALARYEYHENGLQVEMLPLDVMIAFSGDSPTTMLTATFYKPIIGALADGTPLYPIGAVIPLTVTGASSNGRDFEGDLLGTQYLFDWVIEPAGGGELVWNGVVGWAGGRYEQTTISNARLAPVGADFDEDRDVDGDDLAEWRIGFGIDGTADHMDGDADADQDVDGADFLAWQRQLGSAAPAVSANAPVPEPATSMLVITAAVGIRRSGGRMRQKLVSA